MKLARLRLENSTVYVASAAVNVLELDAVKHGLDMHLEVTTGVVLVRNRKTGKVSCVRAWATCDASDDQEDDADGDDSPGAASPSARSARSRTR